MVLSLLWRTLGTSEWNRLSLLLLTHTINEINFIGLVNSNDYYKRLSMMVRRMVLWAWVSNWGHVRRGNWLHGDFLEQGQPVGFRSNLKDFNGDALVTSARR